MLDFFAVPVGLACLWYAWRTLRAGRTLIMSLLSWLPSTTEQVPSDDHPLPIELKELEEHLQTLGFSPVGVTHTSQWMVAKAYIHYYIETSGEVYTELVNFPRGGFVGFSSWFKDDSLLLTTYPHGEKIHQTKFYSNFAMHSLEGSYTYHRRQLQSWRESRGSPITFSNLEDILRFEPIYAKRHQIRHLWKRTVGLFVLTLLRFTMTVISGYIAILYLTLESAVIVMQNTFIAVVPGLFMTIIYYFVWRWLRPSANAVDGGG